MSSSKIFSEEICGRRSSSSRTSLSSSRTEYSTDNRINGSSHIPRRNSDSVKDSLMSNNGVSTCSTGAIPLTKNVGVSVNFGKLNTKSYSSSSAGAQHITSNGHQEHQQQQHTPGTTSQMATSTVNNANSHNTNNNNGNNSAAINLGHGHIGTIAGPPSVSISSGMGLVVGVGPSSCSGVNHSSSLSSSSPAVSALTTCANKGVPSSHNQQQQHLSASSPTTNHPQMSPHFTITPILKGKFVFLYLMIFYHKKWVWQRMFISTC